MLSPPSALIGNALDGFVCIAGSRERGRQMRRAIHHEFEEVPGQTEACRLLCGDPAPLVFAKLDDLDEESAPEQVSTEGSQSAAGRPSFPNSARSTSRSACRPCSCPKSGVAAPIRALPSRVDVALQRCRRRSNVERRSLIRRWLARAAVSNCIRHDDEVPADIEWLACGEQEIGNTRLQELRASASCPMRHQGRHCGGREPKRRAFGNATGGRKFCHPRSPARYRSPCEQS